MKKLHPTAARLLVDIEAYRKMVDIDRTTFGREAAGDGHFISRVEGGKLPRLDTIDRVYRYMKSKTSAVRKAAGRALPLLLLALLVAPALAQVDYIVPRIPTEAEKADALRQAYAPVPRAAQPLAVKNAIDKQADLNMDDVRKFSRKFVLKTDVCARHGMRKVVTRHGKSWRCK